MSRLAKNEFLEVPFNVIDGVPTISKTFVLPPEVDPELIREEPFVKDGYKFVYERMDKVEQKADDVKIAEETFSLDTSTNDLTSVLASFPSVQTYDKEGYSGELALDTKSVKLEVAQYNNITDTHPHTITKVYSVARNDRSLIPDSVQEDGLELPLISLTWSEEVVTPGSDVPTGWRATAVYSATTYTTRQEASAYRATATYRGQVTKSDVASVKYIVRYTGAELLDVPDLPTGFAGSSANGTTPESTNAPNAQSALEEADQSDPSNLENTPGPAQESPLFRIVLIALGIIALCLLIFTIWYIRWHIAEVYVLDQNHHIHIVASRHFIHVSDPYISLETFQGRKETLYTIVLHKRLARKLVGEEIEILNRGGDQVHTVKSFVGSEYTFQVIIPKRQEYESN